MTGVWIPGGAGPRRASRQPGAGQEDKSLPWGRGGEGERVIRGRRLRWATAGLPELSAARRESRPAEGRPL